MDPGIHCRIRSDLQTVAAVEEVAAVASAVARVRLDVDDDDRDDADDEDDCDTLDKPDVHVAFGSVAASAFVVEQLVAVVLF